MHSETSTLSAPYNVVKLAALPVRRAPRSLSSVDLAPWRSGTAIAARRPFHSHERPAPSGPFDRVERGILAAAFKYVPEHGFGEVALARGVADAGYPDVSINLFPRGVFDLVNYHLVTQRHSLKTCHLEGPSSPIEHGRAGGETKEAEGDEEVRHRVRHLLWSRLLANRSIIHRWHEVRSSSGLDWTHAHRAGWDAHGDVLGAGCHGIP